jgi:hypothetical protein
MTEPVNENATHSLQSQTLVYKKGNHNTVVVSRKRLAYDEFYY